MRRASRALKAALDELEAELDETGIAEANLAFNLTWHDWLNLKSLLLVSNSIRFAALSARRLSRGAHFGSIFPRSATSKLALYLRHVARRPVRIDDAAGGVHAREAGRDAARRIAGGCVRFPHPVPTPRLLRVLSPRTRGEGLGFSLSPGGRERERAGVRGPPQTKDAEVNY